MISDGRVRCRIINPGDQEYDEILAQLEAEDSEVCRRCDHQSRDHPWQFRTACGFLDCPCHCFWPSGRHEPLTAR